MSVFRHWRALVLGLALAAPAAAGPLDLPEFDQNSGHFFDGSAQRRGSSAVLPGQPPLRGSVPNKLEPAPEGKPRRKRKPFFDDPKRQAEFEESIGAHDHSGSPYFLGDTFGPAVQNAFHPVLGVAVSVADRLYSVMTVHVLSHVLPDDLSRNFEKASSTDSYSTFDRIFHEKEAVFLRDLSNNYPHMGQNSGMGSPNDYQRYRDWQNWAGSRQIDVFANSFGSWAIERYRLQATGDKFGKDIKNRKNWTPGTIAVAIVGGGVMGWFFGIQQPLYYGPMRMHINLHSADAVVRAMQNDGGVGRVAGIELGPKDDHWPVAYFNEEIKGGKWVTNTYGLKLSRRFHTRPWD